MKVSNMQFAFGDISPVTANGTFLDAAFAARRRRRISPKRDSFTQKSARIGFRYYGKDEENAL